MKKFVLVAIFFVGAFANDTQRLENECNANDGVACNQLGLMYANGTKIRQNYNKAIQLFKTACDLKNEYGCNNLGWLYQNGQGVKQNKNKAKEFFGKACDYGDQSGCNEYATLNRKKK